MEKTEQKFKPGDIVTKRITMLGRFIDAPFKVIRYGVLDTLIIEETTTEEKLRWCVHESELTLKKAPQTVIKKGNLFITTQ